ERPEYLGKERERLLHILAHLLSGERLDGGVADHHVAGILHGPRLVTVGPRQHAVSLIRIEHRHLPRPLGAELLEEAEVERRIPRSEEHTSELQSREN